MYLKHAVERLAARRFSLLIRLASFFTLGTAAILLVVSALLYDELKQELRTKDNAELMEAAASLSDMLIELGESNTENWRREWRENIARSQRLAARVLTPNGKVYVTKPGFAIPSIAFPTQGTTQTAGIDYSLDERTYLLTARSAEVQPGQTWRIEVALNLTQSQDVLRAYRKKLALLLLIALCAMSATGWLIAKRGLQPLMQIGQEMHRISANKLSTRMGTQPWPQELHELANAFDAMLDRLEASFIQLNRFSADMAHEVRTPLNNLIAAASVTLTRQREYSEYQDALETIVEECEHLKHIVDTMLFLARADNASEALHMKQLDVHDEFQRQIDFFESKAAEKGMTITSEGCASLTADPMLLRRALSNLIDNAIRYAAAGSTLTLRANQTDEAVQLSVQDTGTGISSEHFPHLFDRFYRVDAQRQEAAGAGLGLAIVRSIASLHGGQVSVISQVGHGSTFTLTLPR